MRGCGWQVFQFLARNVEAEAVARIDVRGAEEGGEARAIRRIVRYDRAQARTGPGAPPAEFGEIVGLGHVRGEHQEHGLVERLRDLVEPRRRRWRASHA